MGVVWEAVHTVTGRRLALKVMKPGAGDERRARFFREARVSCSIVHPHIVPVHDVLELEDGTPVMVMDALDGESLRSKLRRERTLVLADAARLLLPVVSAVGAAHAAGVIHRDLKPENIFLEEEPSGLERVRVLDFGVAKLIALPGADGPASLTSGGFVGTPTYMAPEQVFAERDLDHRVDVWALGVVLYECLSGRAPTNAESAGQAFKRITSHPIEPLALAVPTAPPELCALVMRMLARDREARPSLREVAELLGRHTGARAPAFEAPRLSSSPPIEASLSGENEEDPDRPGPPPGDGSSSAQRRDFVAATLETGITHDPAALRTGAPLATGGTGSWVWIGAAVACGAALVFANVAWSRSASTLPHLTPPSAVPVPVPVPSATPVASALASALPSALPPDASLLESPPRPSVSASSRPPLRIAPGPWPSASTRTSLPAASASSPPGIIMSSPY